MSDTVEPQRRLRHLTLSENPTHFVCGVRVFPTTTLGPNYLFVFVDGHQDANWQGATKGFIGDVAVNGSTASERTSGTVPFAGTIYSSDATLGAWQNIVTKNAGQAFARTG